MKRNPLAVAVSLFLACILVLSTIAIGIVLGQAMTAEIGKLPVPVGHMVRAVNPQN
jgi:hypothetical protein